MAERYPARVNLRMTQETYDAYDEAAKAVGMETTALIRQMVDANGGAVIAVAQAAEAAQAGRVKDAAALYAALMRSVMAQGSLGLVQAEVLEKQMAEVEAAARE